MRVLLAHGYSEEYADHTRLQRWLSRLRFAGFKVDDFYVGMGVRGMRLPFSDLDRLWRSRNERLLTTYEELTRVSESYGVLINFGGVNLHPEFLRLLTPITILRFSDDPESSEQVSRHIAPYHDICAPANVAELDLYRSWGVKHVYWVPMGFWSDEYNPSLTETNILNDGRTQDVTLLCERVNPYRRASVDRYSLAFPQGVFRGSGWPDGFLPENDRVPLLQRTRIGINTHNSTGPINSRTYYLPANGVMQICDNKRHLGNVYEVGKEVVGYESIDEAIELTHYYLAHEDERRQIAAAGFRRAISDYTETECFGRMLDTVHAFLEGDRKREALPSPIAVLDQHRRSASGEPPASIAALLWFRWLTNKIVRGGGRRAALALSTLRLMALRLINRIPS
jgi:hypothetical protein